MSTRHQFRIGIIDMSKFPSEEQDRFIVRMPDGLRDRIKAASDASGRSMNAEIVATLLHAYPEPIRGRRIPLRQVLESMRSQLADPNRFGMTDDEVKAIRAYVDAKERAIAADPALAQREYLVAYDSEPHGEPE